ncbi:MAG: hypothetical protein P9E88_18000 [Candidatus Competibacter sp.]|jgi:hypothetical protein|nr:hypothetical protein [Candidatus Competibacter sp.]
MPITLAVPLDLPDVRVLANQMLEKSTVLIEVESTVRTAQRHRCGQEIDRFHGFDRSGNDPGRSESHGEAGVHGPVGGLRQRGGGGVAPRLRWW